MTLLMRPLYQSNNKPGTAQVGAISKAQKYSRRNYWKHLEKKIFFFQKKVFGKKVAQCRKTKQRPFRLIKRSFTNRKFQKMQGGTL